MSVMSTSGAAGSIYANRRKRGGKKTVSREGASKTARARGGMSPASNAGAGGRRARSFAPTEPLATPARRRSLEKSRPRGGVGKKPPQRFRSSSREKRDADLAQRSRASYKKAKSGGAFTRVAQGKAAPRRGTSPVSAGRGLGASGVKEARKSAMASSAAARKQLHKTSRTLSQTARKRDMAEASPARKKEMQASQQQHRKEAASWARKKPPAGARTEAYKKAPPAQSAQMAERKAYGRAAEGFAKKRAAPASPAQKRRANLSGGKPIPKRPPVRQGAYKKAAQAMRADVKKRTRTTNQRRASAAKRVAGRGVRGPGLGGRR